jgi:uncharacterized lipoprotein YmbA
MTSACRIKVALLALTIAACASSPPTLVALPPAPHATATQNTVERSGPTVLLRRVIVPGYLDAFPVLIGRRGNALIVSDGTEWAERLSDGAARVLREALSQRLGPSRVLIEGDGRIPHADLSIELLALDPQDGELRLDARWTFLGSAGDRTSRAGRTQLHVPLDSPTPSGVATATADALGRLADTLAVEAERVTLRLADDNHAHQQHPHAH